MDWVAPSSVATVDEVLLDTLIPFLGQLAPIEAGPRLFKDFLIDPEVLHVLQDILTAFLVLDKHIILQNRIKRLLEPALDIRQFRNEEIFGIAFVLSQLLLEDLSANLEVLFVLKPDQALKS